MSVIRLCSSATVLVGLAVFGFESTATGDGEAAGAIAGDGEGNATGVGDGEGEAVAVAVDLRSRCAVALKLASGIVAIKNTDNRNTVNLVFLINSDHLWLALFFRVAVKTQLLILPRL